MSFEGGRDRSFEAERVSVAVPVEPVTASATLRSVLDLLGVGVIVGDRDGAARLANSTWLRITGQTGFEWLGSGWLSILEPALRERERRGLLRAIGEGHVYHGEWNLSNGAGGPRWLRVQASPEVDRDGGTGFVATASDVTDERNRAERLVHAATHDPLTGLYNRAQFFEFARHAFERARRSTGRRLAVAFIDIDGLKAINDERGHEAGDWALVTAARSIERALRPTDTVARYGGDEFVVLCEDLTDEKSAAKVARRIIDGAARPIDHSEPVSLSVGFAFVDDPDVAPARVIAEGDRAMYRAKREAHGQFSIAPAPSPRSAGRHDLQDIRDSDYLAVAAHEMATPLTVVAGLAATLRQRIGTLTPSELEATLITMARHATRLTELFDNVLDIAHLEAGGAPAPQPVALGEAVADAVLLASPKGQKSIDVVGDRDAYALADPVGLSRVFVNLLSNAYRYGGENIVVEIGDHDPDRVVTVADDGPGVPPQVVGMLFNRFAHGPGTGGQRGTGLGLAIARQLVRSYGGELSYEPNVPKGSRFIIRLVPADRPLKAS